MRLTFISHPQCLPQCLPLHLRRSRCPLILLLLPTVQMPLLTSLHPQLPFSSPWTLLCAHNITPYPRRLTRSPTHQAIAPLHPPLITRLSQKHQMISSYLRPLASLARAWCVHVDAIAFVGHVALASAFWGETSFLQSHMILINDRTRYCPHCYWYQQRHLCVII